MVVGVELLEGEEILWKGRPSWRSMVSFYIKWFVIALIPGVVAQVLETTGAIDDARTSYFWPLTIILLVVTVLIGWLRRLDTQYMVTNKRIHIRQGLLSRRDHSTQHARIQNVNTDQSIIERMLNVGDVDFDTAGSDDFDFRFDGIDDPHGLVTLIAKIEAQPATRQGV
jgi:uncharacterized membrane protein YdbT with pleckstrin-like domain